jgi:hypothetical protein
MATDSFSSLPWTDGKRGRLKPEFFRMLREMRWTRIRLSIEVIVLGIAIILFFVLPLAALVVVVPVGVAVIFDLILFGRLRTRIAETWEDLTLEPW